MAELSVQNGWQAAEIIPEHDSLDIVLRNCRARKRNNNLNNKN